MIALARHLWPAAILDTREFTEQVEKSGKAVEEALKVALAESSETVAELKQRLESEKVAAAQGLDRMRQECDRLKSDFDSEKAALGKVVAKANEDCKRLSMSLLKKDEELQRIADTLKTLGIQQVLFGPK